MITSHRFAFAIVGVFATFVFSACQPSADSVDNTKIEPNEEVIPPVANPEINTDMDDYVDDNISASDMVADGVPMTDMLKSYNKSIAKMHDEMMIGMGYNDPDTAFAKSMLGHHRGALDMAQIQIKYATDTDMLKLAQDITASQQVEIDIIRKWLASHPDSAKPKPNTQVMQQAYANDVESMREDMMAGFADPIPDLAFARGMQAHHKGAVDMALIQLKYGADEEMRDLALQIINRQQLEVQLIESWIAAHDTSSNDTDAAIDSITDNDDSIDDDLTGSEADK